MKLRMHVIFGVLALLVCATDGGVQTQASPASDAGPRNRIEAVREVKLGHEVGEVRINGYTVFRFRGAQTTDPYARAQIVASRLNAAYMSNLQPGEIRVSRLSGYWVVTARGYLLITADAWTARINRTSPRGLARQWAAAVRHRLRP